MRKKRRTEIVVEREQVLVIKRLDNRESRRCVECGGQTEMVSVDEGAVLTCLSARAIYRRVEAGQLHFIETEEGLLLVCVHSLLDPG
jgi:hypothetical protein